MKFYNFVKTFYDHSIVHIFHKNLPSMFSYFSIVYLFIKINKKYKQTFYKII